ncbi:ComEA family DNA-binding protein [Persephonella sp.]
MKFTEGKVSSKLLQIQFISVFLIISAGMLWQYFPAYQKSRYSLQDLKLNVNSADVKQLIQVPYIGQKTAEKIIQIREKSGKITDLKQLENLRYYKRFKYFLKVE